jgi:hypothetical protein
MITLETRIKTNESGEDVFEEGYFLSIYDLARLVRDFQADCHDGFVSNDTSYIEQWLKNHNRL